MITADRPVLEREEPLGPAVATVLRVLIADDHPLFRRGIARAVKRRPGLELVGEATDGREALELCDALSPDVVVLDHRMPGLTGVEVARRLHGRRRAPGVLLLSAFEDAEIVWDAVSAGAAGYIGKTAPPAEVCDAIEQVGQGISAFTETTWAGVEHGLLREEEGEDPERW